MPVGLAVCLQGSLVGRERFGVVGQRGQGVAALFLRVCVQQAGARLQVGSIRVGGFLVAFQVEVDLAQQEISVPALLRLRIGLHQGAQ